jgi:hypothetical protein
MRALGLNRSRVLPAALLLLFILVSSYATISKRPLLKDTICGRPNLVVFAHFGVLERARGCVHQPNLKNIFRSATLNYTIPHVLVGVAIDEGGLIDGLHISSSETSTVKNLVRYDSLQVLSSSELDAESNLFFCSKGLCEKPFWREDYTESHIRNALRVLLCEKRLQAMLRNYPDSVIVALSPDIMANGPLDPLDISVAHCRKNTIFVTNNNPGDGGVTNGFYVGHSQAMISALSTYSKLEEISNLGSQFDYESMVRLAFQFAGLGIKTLRGFEEPMRSFVKVRATGEVFGELACSAKQDIDQSTCPQLKEASCFSIQ